MVPEVGEYHAIIVTRYWTSKDTFVSAIINLEGMIFQNDYLVTRRGEINIPSRNKFQPGVNGNIMLKSKMEDLLKLNDYDMIMVILTFRLGREVDWRSFLSEDSFKFSRRKQHILQGLAVDIAVTGEQVYILRNIKQQH